MNYGMDNYVYFSQATVHLRDAYNKLITNQAKHELSHNCFGACQQSKQNLEMLDYVSRQLYLLKIVYMRDSLIKRKFERDKK